MEQQINISLNAQLRTSITRGLKWYKESLKIMKQVIVNITDSKLISNEIESIEHVINQLNQQTFRSLPKETVLNQSCNRSLIQKTISDLKSNVKGRVLGWITDDHWLEVRYIPAKGYELRIKDEIVRETSDLEVITEAFVSWGARKRIDIKEKAH